MEARKQFLATSRVDEELKRLLDNARQVRVTEAQLQEQRISFAYGNAPESDLITKETVRQTSLNIRLA